MTRSAFLQLSAAMVLGSGTSACAETAPAAENLPAHPRLLLNKEGIAALKERIAKASWAKAEWDSLKADADKQLTLPVNLPPRGGNWSHNYVCPTHGARLKRGKKIGEWEWEHHCPEGPHILRGDQSKATLDFDGNAIAAVHSDLARQVADHGLVYLVTGDERHARKGRDILLAYAERYHQYPLHDNQGRPGKGGRIASQALTEGSWVIEFCHGADLVWATLSADDRKRIEEGVLRPALNEIIIPAKGGIHNITCRLNSAIGLSGFLLGDKELIDRAIDNPERGYRQQMEKGVRDDGMWLEGSSGYHFFTIDGVWPLTEAARNCGMDLYGPKFKAMYDAPFVFAMPNLVLPDFNDSNEVALSSREDSYELAYARYKNPVYTSLISKGKRNGRMALLFGVPELPKGGAVSLGSRNSPSSGYAILEGGKGEQATWVCLKYGPHGGGHGHPDKNHFTLYTRGGVLAPDGGTHAYGSPLHNGWDKATIAHNTLVVNQKSQSSAEGKCLAFGSEKGVDYAVTDAGPIYEGVRFVRTTALLTPDLVVFLDMMQADIPGDPPTLDLAYHHIGAWGEVPSGTPWTAPDAPGYKFLKNATVRSTADTLILPLVGRDKRKAAVVIAAGPEPTEVITGNGIRKSTEDIVPMLLMRRTAKRAATLWAVSLDGAPVTLTIASVKDNSGAVLPMDDAASVQVASGGKQWKLLINPDKKAITAEQPGGKTWQSEAVLTVG
jgi:hypothetical protein